MQKVNANTKHSCYDAHVFKCRSKYKISSIERLLSQARNQNKGLLKFKTRSFMNSFDTITAALDMKTAIGNVSASCK